MNQEILFATHNRGKLAEARNYLSPLGYLVYGLDDLFLSEEVVEDGKSYEDNAYKKAKAFESLPFPVFSDDSGLEVEALGGKEASILHRRLRRRNPQGARRRPRLRLRSGLQVEGRGLFRPGEPGRKGQGLPPG